MRIAITGASGNVGTALLRRLHDHDLVGVSRRVPPDSDEYAHVRWVSVDLASADPGAGLYDAFAGADAVVHCAWMIQPSHDRELMRRVNVGGTRAVLAAARASGVGHLVHLSSLGAYAPAPGRTVDELWPATGMPSSSYSVDKAEAEQLLDSASELTVARMRPTLVLQPAAATEIRRYFLGRWPVRLLPSMATRLAPWPSGLQLQFVHADDVAAAIEVVLRERAGGAFNVAADPVLDRAGYAALMGGVGPDVPRAALRSLATATWRAHLQPTDAGWVDLAFDAPLLDTSRLRSLGWVPQHAGDDTLREFVDALLSGRAGTGPLLG